MVFIRVVWKKVAGIFSRPRGLLKIFLQLNVLLLVSPAAPPPHLSSWGSRDLRLGLGLSVLDGQVGPFPGSLLEAARTRHVEVPAAGALVEHRIHLGVVVGVAAGDGRAAAGLLLLLLGRGGGAGLLEGVKVGLEAVARRGGGRGGGAILGALPLGQEGPPPLGPLGGHGRRGGSEVGCGRWEMIGH